MDAQIKKLELNLQEQSVSLQEQAARSLKMEEQIGSIAQVLQSMQSQLKELGEFQKRNNGGSKEGEADLVITGSNSASSNSAKINGIVFCPVWLFHLVIARGRFSLPAPSVPRDRHWAPCHAIVAAPLIVAFELLLCLYLEGLRVYGFPVLSLKVVFVPLLAFQTIILIDNFRMCRALMPGDEENLNDEAIWETLPHFWVAISMVFFVAATLFTMLKLCGDIGALGWWDLFINFSIAECFAFLVCTKWTNPLIHKACHTSMSSVSSSTISYLDWTSGLVVCPEEDQNQETLCGLSDIGGHLMKIPIIVFQVLLCMRLEGTPAGARYIPLPVLFSPVFLLLGVGVLFAASCLMEKIVLLLHSEAVQGQYIAISTKVCDCLAFMRHGSRLLGWWSLDEGSREEQARLWHEGTSGYNTFCSYPPEIVKKMPKKELAEEVWRLQAALGQQSEITKISRQEYERLQNEKVLCRVCFEREISIVLLPCRHRILCWQRMFKAMPTARFHQVFVMVVDFTLFSVVYNSG